MAPKRRPTAPFLSGDQIGLRHPDFEDARHATSWIERPFPLNQQRAEALLRETEVHAWGSSPAIRLIADTVTDGTTMGGVVVHRNNDRVASVRLSAAIWLPDTRRDEVNAEILALLMPWMLGELDLMVIRVDIPVDHALTIQRARTLGMREAVRLREHVRRPRGRVDLLTFESINPAWAHTIPEHVEDRDA